MLLCAKPYWLGEVPALFHPTRLKANLEFMDRRLLSCASFSTHHIGGVHVRFLDEGILSPVLLHPSASS